VIASKYSLVIPIFNEEQVLPKLFERLGGIIDKLDGSTEIILIDDGSSDNSYHLLQQQFQKDSRFKVIKFSRNFGHQNAVTAGLDQAAGEAVIVMDADLQDPPEVVFDLIKQWQAGFDIVHAVRQSRQGESWFKLTSANFFYRFLEKITETKIIRNAGDFRLMDQKVVRAFRLLKEKHRFIRGLSCWIGFKQGCVLYERHARFAGETKYPLKKMVNLAVNAITSFSDWPLRLSFFIGSIISFLSMLAIVGIITTKIFTNWFIPGWTSVIVILTFFNGIIMIMLGLMGIYVGKIFQEIKGRPLYIVEAQHGLSTNCI
jgi:dolichol-phosphate mannosyltransferase